MVMVFSSLKFICIFMPVFFTVYYILPAKCRNFLLLSGSLVFYFVGTIEMPAYFMLFVLSIFVDFFVGAGIERYSTRKKLILGIGICFHLITFGFLKYSGFVTGEMTKLIPGFDTVFEIVMPIGISFYTFQGVSYIIDVYRGTIKAEESLLRYAVYISMFEQLIAGPIVTYSQVKDELSKRQISINIVLHGMGVFVFGLGLKVLLANPLGKLWSQVGAIGFESISTPLAWMSLVAYTFQIYFDFFGYSLMAIGLGEMLGFKLPINFNHPYTSLTMTEFWRRWHITLGSWFREYVYIPLGGNKEGGLKTIRNLFAVWMLTGIWHGAGYNFIIWGFVIFLIITIEKLFTGRFFKNHHFFGHIYMIVLIPLTWAVFAIEDIKQLGIFFKRLFPFGNQEIWSVFQHDYLKYFKSYGIILLVGLLFSTKFPYQKLKSIGSRIVIFIVLTAILTGSLYCMYRGLDDPFLYYRF